MNKGEYTDIRKDRLGLLLRVTVNSKTINSQKNMGVTTLWRLQLSLMAIYWTCARELFTTVVVRTHKCCTKVVLSLISKASILKQFHFDRSFEKVVFSFSNSKHQNYDRSFLCKHGLNIILIFNFPVTPWGPEKQIQLTTYGPRALWWPGLV